VSNEISYNVLRDFMLPVTSTSRDQDAASGFPLTNFKSLRDQTITAQQGVHGVRETFQYTFPGGVVDTFDEDVLTNADQTIVYFLMVHCTDACYSQNQNNINTVMSSFTVGSPT
jgi:NADH:ubiquinone oxidoreductase subunit D